MRVQRAPGAADQPQQAPADLARRAAIIPSSSVAAAGDVAPALFAETEVDLTGLLRSLDESQVVAELVLRLVTAFRLEGLVDDASALQVLRPTDQGMVGVRFAHAVDQSAYAISSGLLSMSSGPQAIASGTLTVVDLTGSRVHARSGDWGAGGLGVVTLGRIVPTVVSCPQASSPGFVITQRHIARLGFTAHHRPASVRAVVRAFDRLTRSVEGQEGEGIE